MDIFNSFFAQEWVKVTTIGVYVVLLCSVPILYRIMAKTISGQAREMFISACWEIYGVVFFLALVPTGYLILYFFNSDSSFVEKDPLPWVCFLGGLGATFDYIRTCRQLALAVEINNSRDRVKVIQRISRLSKMSLILGLIPLIYGAVMIVLTNSSYLEKLPAMTWFLSFMITGLAIIYAVYSKGFLVVSQAYASNPSLADGSCNKRVT